MLDRSKCFAVNVKSYPSAAPFSPSEKYEEYLFEVCDTHPNPVYAGFRELLHSAGYDLVHYGTSDWNPLGEWVHPGETVLIKPNWVKHVYNSDVQMDYLISHPSLIRVVSDYVLLALKGSGCLLIGDAPVQSADFDQLQTQTGMPTIMEFLRAKHPTVDIRVMDFRYEVANVKDGIIVNRDKQRVGHKAVSLGLESKHGQGRRFDKYRVTHYDPTKMQLHHSDNVHEYLIAEPALLADVIVNIPKLKTHRKAGITCSLKNQVGINASKDWLPHHCIGSRRFHGDEYLYPSPIKFLLRFALDQREKASRLFSKKWWNLVTKTLKQCRRIPLLEIDPYFEGSWYGNDTLWRTIHDLNRLIMYADKQGVMTERVQRRLLYFVDAIVIGEGEGPLHPSPKGANILMWGENPAVVDACAAAIIGLDPSKIASIDKAFDPESKPICTVPRDQVGCRIGAQSLRPFVDRNKMVMVRARPSRGWIGHIELYQPEKTNLVHDDLDSDY